MDRLHDVTSKVKIFEERVAAHMDPDIINMMKWKAFLKENPEFSKWYEYLVRHALEEEGLEVPEHGLPDFRTSLDALYNCPEDEFHPMNVLWLYDEIIGRASYSGHLALSDEGLLAWATGIEYRENAENILWIIRRIREYRVNFEEAKFVTSYYGNDAHHKKDDAYLRILCARELHEDPRSKSVEYYAKKARKIKSSIEFLIFRYGDQPHVKWETPEDFVRTVCRYGAVDLLATVSSRLNINKDYLDDFLLAPRPKPKEISESSWHHMSVKFVKSLDKGNEPFIFSDFMPWILTYDFLNHDIESLTFMETVYGLCNPIRRTLERNQDTLVYQPGMLKPKLFDMLHEHSSSFVRPLFKDAMSRMILRYTLFE